MQTPRVVRVLAAWLLALLLTVAGFFVAVVVLNAGVYGPQQQVRDYLAALKEGDGGLALGILNGSAPTADAALLDGPALARGAAAVEDVRVQDPVETTNGHVDVPVTYSIDGSDHTTRFPLKQTGTQWFFFSTWEFVPSTLPTVDFSVANLTEAKLNGARVALPGGSGRFASLYPVRVEGGFEGEFFTAPAKAVAVTDRAAAPKLALPAAATEKLVEAVDTEIRAFLDACAAQTVFQPTNCPFNFQTSQRLAGEISWSITDYPAVRIDPHDGEWVIAPLAGSATLSTRLQDLFSGAISDVTEKRPFEFLARLRIDGSTVTVTPVIEY
ncbi:hypothetical protein [Arthrobacter zhaoguopingii]|uniref:hypothetical protein n=1 Tax=Arthrobacter zhaoguopingii TaxID=2681491 RepID=UPI00135CDBFD|nr:hypothetical protein [Arthrobacter zhaoguopingii]